MEINNIWTTASKLIEAHGNAAAAIACARADKAQRLGDMDTFKLWVRVIGMVNHLSRQDKHDGELLN